MAEPMFTIIKEFQYRGSTEEWSNSYHWSDIGSDPETYRNMIDQIIELEKTCYSSRVTVVRALVYSDSGPGHPSIYTYHLADFAGVVSGTLAAGSSLGLAGDDAVWVRWATGKVNSRGKATYLRKYFHDARSDGSPTLDSIFPAQVTALQAFGDAMLSDLGSGSQMVDPEGDVPDGPAKAGTFVTTRTLKRRSPRP